MKFQDYICKNCLQDFSESLYFSNFLILFFFHQTSFSINVSSLEKVNNARIGEIDRYVEE